MKVMTVFGTRPEIIRLSEVMKKLDRCVEHVMIHTGQNYDHRLSTVFFDELGLGRPKHTLEVRSETVGGLIANIIRETERVMLVERPDALLVLGDTNSALCAIAAKRLRIPIFHMEAGNRCFDERVPEEINRRIVDHISDVNLAYSENSRLYLLREGIDPGRIWVTGSPLKEVLAAQSAQIEASGVLKRLGLEREDYYLASLHREENVDDPTVLRRLVETLERLSERDGLSVVVSTHPRTRKKLDELDIRPSKQLRFEPPFGFFEYVRLQIEARCVLSDSGTIFEESAILKFPAVVLRRSTERPEAVDAGGPIQCGTDAETIIAAVDLAVKDRAISTAWPTPAAYDVDHVSDKGARRSLGMAKIIKEKTWHTTR